MLSLTSKIEVAVSGAIDRALPAMAGADPLVRRSEHADFQSNASLALAKRAGVNPADLALAVAEALREDADAAIGQVSVSGPGFLNIAIADSSIWG